MKHTLLFAALAAASIFSTGALRAAEFTYHGNLQDAGKPAEGTYDLELTLYSSPEGGKVVAGPLVMYKVPVHEGTFSTEADFGLLTHVSGPSWLGVAVRNAGKGDFAPLSARAPISAAETATNSSCPGSWSLDGNAGNPAGTYLGTADHTSLVFKSNNTQVAVALTSSAGPVPIWLGGLFNTFGGQGGFVGGGGGTSSSDTANANSVGSFGVVGGGQSNSAGTSSISYATVGGGLRNLASKTGATVVGGQNNQATGANSTVAGGEVNGAGGTDSFVGGKGAVATYDHSFVWSDGLAGLVGDSDVNQFDIYASGGVAINGTPKNNLTELSIYPPPGQLNYSNIFMGQTGTTSGMLMSAGNATAVTNSSSFYLDQYDGTNQSRKLSVTTAGLIVNDPSAIPSTVYQGNVALSVVHSAVDVDARIDLFGNTNDQSYIQLDANVSGSFYITKYVPNQPSVNLLTLASNGNFTVTANAFKPGGGTWAATSDRRVKQDIEPIHDAVDTLMKLRPVNFHYTPEYRAMEGGLADKPYAGFIAQEYAEVFPSDVMSTGQHVPGAAKNDPTILALDPNPALITTVAAVQELAVDNIALHKQIDELQARLNKLDAGKGR